MKLLVAKRTIFGKKLLPLRSSGLVPGIIYGKHIAENIPLSFAKNEFIKLYKQTGTSVAFSLEWDGIDQLVLAYNVFLNPVTNILTHVDFLAVVKWEQVEVNVPIHFVGVAPADKNNIGRLQTITSVIRVKADPTLLPKYIEVSLESLVDETSWVFKRDIVLPEGVALIDDGNQPVVVIVPLDDDAA